MPLNVGIKKKRAHVSNVCIFNKFSFFSRRHFYVDRWNKFQVMVAELVSMPCMNRFGIGHIPVSRWHSFNQATQFNQTTPYFSSCKHMHGTEKCSLLATCQRTHAHWQERKKSGSNDHYLCRNDKMPSILLRAIKITASVYPNDEDKWKFALHANHILRLDESPSAPLLICLACNPIRISAKIFQQNISFIIS